jgi:hypothetical protein
MLTVRIDNLNIVIAIDVGDAVYRSAIPGRKIHDGCQCAKEEAEQEQTAADRASNG